MTNTTDPASSSTNTPSPSSASSSHGMGTGPTAMKLKPHLHSTPGATLPPLPRPRPRVPPRASSSSSSPSPSGAPTPSSTAPAAPPPRRGSANSPHPQAAAPPRVPRLRAAPRARARVQDRVQDRRRPRAPRAPQRACSALHDLRMLVVMGAVPPSLSFPFAPVRSPPPCRCPWRWLAARLTCVRPQDVQRGVHPQRAPRRGRARAGGGPLTLAFGGWVGVCGCVGGGRVVTVCGRGGVRGV
ncbi:hypothetical protein B0H15DRAFT_816308 [Mycena belliarum]|uniref:Uncharacterized protein n=1 Tax=Mycena belliarum TaxID=1033014 RepID=A0AAD6UFQ2_9AGAR|nr:hypothetical protein B0H15DRAFT_816308 [Mycena belliae]